MGKLTSAVMIVALSLSVAAPVVGQDESQPKLYGGVGYLPLETSGLDDVHVSDWQNFGTGSAEGRVELPLSSGSANGLHRAYLIGLEFRYEGLPVFAELHYMPLSNYKYGQVAVGLPLRVAHGVAGEFGFRPKIGFTFTQADFGTVSMLPGKTPPVITPEGTFRVGDEISTEMKGGMAAITTYGVLMLGEKVGVHLEVGYNKGFAQDMVITAGEVELKYDSPTVVEPVLDVGNGESSRRSAQINPEVSLDGLAAAVGITFTLTP